MASSVTLFVALIIAICVFLPLANGDRCPSVVHPEYATAFSNYLTKSGLRVNVVHLARSNADENDEELYDHVCLETTSQKIAENQYRLSFTYKGIQGFINVTLFPENQEIPNDESRFVSVIPEGNLLTAVQCNPLEQIHVFLGMIKNSVGRSCATQLRALLDRAHAAAGFAPIKESEYELDQTLAQCCATR